MHKVFVSYHHEGDQWFKDQLTEFKNHHRIFIDRSVDTGDIDDNLSDEAIRTRIRDDYLRDSTVTIVLVGSQTKYRKHVDWEVYSSMHDGRVNRKSGILALYLDGNRFQIRVSHAGEREKLYPDIEQWEVGGSRESCERAFPHMPDRIIDNLLKPEAKISVMPWKRITPEGLRFLIDATYRDIASCEYDLSRPMKRRNTWGTP